MQKSSPTLLNGRKATRTGAIVRASVWPGVVVDPGMCRRSLSLGTGRARVRPLGQWPPVRVGKARSRSRRYTSARSQTRNKSWEADEQGGGTICRRCCGAGGAKAGAKGNANEQSTLRIQSRERVSQALDRVRKAARLRKKEKFTALLHHIGVDLLREAFFALKRDAAPGVDGVTWRTYEADLDLNLTDLTSRVHRGAYRALPSRRTYIPKADGRQRPLAVVALEDKVVQRATVAVPMTFSRNPTSFIRGQAFASPSPPSVGAVCMP